MHKPVKVGKWHHSKLAVEWPLEPLPLDGTFARVPLIFIGVALLQIGPLVFRDGSFESRLVFSLETPFHVVQIPDKLTRGLAAKLHLPITENNKNPRAESEKTECIHS